MCLRRVLDHDSASAGATVELGADAEAHGSLERHHELPSAAAYSDTTTLSMSMADGTRHAIDASAPYATPLL